MKIEVPLSPWESDIGNVTPNENATAKPVSGRKATPFRSKKVHQLNENSPDVRSFCLDRPPLADIGNEENVTESARDKVVGDLITLTPMTGHKNNTSEDGTPKIFTGGKGEAVKRVDRQGIVPVPDLLSFDPVGDGGTSVQQLQETIEFLEGELVKSRAPQDALEKEVEELKDFVVVMDKEKRAVEKRLEDALVEVHDMKVTLEEARAEASERVTGTRTREIALQNKVRSLQAVLQMVTSEKEALTQFSCMERDLEKKEWEQDKKKIEMLEKQKSEASGRYSQAEVDALVAENDTLLRKMRYVTKKLSAYQSDLDAAAPQIGHLSRELQRWFEHF